MTRPSSPQPSSSRQTVAGYDAAAMHWEDPGQLGYRSPAFAHRLRQMILDLLAPAAGSSRALELGGGTGWLLDATAPLFGELTVIEPSAEMRAVCHRRVDSLRLTNVTVTDGDAAVLSGIEAATVDVIYAVGLLDAVPDPDQVLKTCARVLKPDGWLVVSTSNGACPWYGLRDRVFGVASVRTGRYLSPAALAAAAAAAGFVAVDERTWSAAPPRLAWPPALAALASMERLMVAAGLSRYLGVLSASFRRAG